MKTLLLQTRAVNEGNQNKGQVPGAIIADLEIFPLLIGARKATSFKSQWLNCLEINQLT